MQLRNTTQSYQSELASYCRTGELGEIPGIVKNNVAQYRRLVYNVIDDMLQNAYPLTYDLLKETDWDQTVTDFFSNHPCRSPQVWYMPKEFYEYLTGMHSPVLNTYPFLKELLWFEWMEVELFMMEDKPVNASPNGNLLTDTLMLNPEHALLSFEYPVHQLPPKKITVTDKGNYFVVAHRNTKGEVVFTDAAAAIVRMIEYLAEMPYTIDGLFIRFEEEYQLQLTKTHQQAVIDFLQTALEQGLIAGFVSNPK